MGAAMKTEPTFAGYIQSARPSRQTLLADFGFVAAISITRLYSSNSKERQSTRPVIYEL